MTDDEGEGEGQHGDAPTGMERLDGLVPESWEADSIEQLDKWRQGDLIAGCPLFWAGPAGPDRVLGTVDSGEAWDVVECPADS